MFKIKKIKNNWKAEFMWMIILNNNNHNNQEYNTLDK